jgi:hypothetical protein
MEDQLYLMALYFASCLFLDCRACQVRAHDNLVNPLFVL